MIEHPFKEHPEPENSMGQEAGQERRIAVRKVLIVRKMTLAEIVVGDSGVPRIHYVYINDISETGIRLSSDILFSPEKKIRLKLFLNKPITVEVCLRWKKEIGINNYVNGMEFVVDTPEQKAGLQKLITWAEPYFEKSSFKLNHTLFLQTNLGKPLDGVYVYALSISPGRLEILSNTPLPENREFSVQFSLHQDLSPITTVAQVMHMVDTTPEELDSMEHRNYTIWLEFNDSTAVKEHLAEMMAEQPPPSHL